MPIPFAAFFGDVVGACVSCNIELREAILAHRFILFLFTIAPVTLAGGFLAGWLARTVVQGMTRSQFATSQARTAWAAAMLGAGSGGLLDSILLHQILQVHDMVSNSLPPLTLLAKGVNVFWSGVFDLAALVLMLLGMNTLRTAGLGSTPVSAGFFWGAFLMGWGLFNSLDGMVFHILLRFHNLVEATQVPFAWNLSWWFVGTALAVVGIRMMRSDLPRRFPDADPTRNPLHRHQPKTSGPAENSSAGGESDARSRPPRS